MNALAVQNPRHLGKISHWQENNCRQYLTIIIINYNYYIILRLYYICVCVCVCVLQLTLHSGVYRNESLKHITTKLTIIKRNETFPKMLFFGYYTWWILYLVNLSFPYECAGALIMIESWNFLDTFWHVLTRFSAEKLHSALGLDWNAI